MKSSDRYDAELKQALAKKDKYYVVMLRAAGKCKELDRAIKRLRKARNRTKQIEKKAAATAFNHTVVEAR